MSSIFIQLSNHKLDKLRPAALDFSAVPLRVNAIAMFAPIPVYVLSEGWHAPCFLPLNYVRRPFVSVKALNDFLNKTKV